MARVLFAFWVGVTLGVKVSTPDHIRLQVARNGSFDVSSEQEGNAFHVYTEHGNEVIWIECSEGNLANGDCLLKWNKTGSFRIISNSIGQDFIKFNKTANLTSTVTRVQIIKSEGLYIFNQVIGWVYFLAWTVSFYPQIVLNFRRKTVAGLNFDFCLLNIIGFACYSAYNLALFTSDTIFQLYEKKHPDGVNPVLPNDIFFSVHAVFASTVTGIQILAYDKAGQRVSIPGGVFAGACMLTASLGTIAPAVNAISWLDYLTILSSIKLAITIVKYVPQAVMNYRRKSTEGWSIGNVLLDLTGGSFSLLQMLLQGLNNQQYSNIFGDPTKFGLGLFSILFDLLFIVQHYCLYRGNLPYSAQLDDYQRVD